MLYQHVQRLIDAYDKTWTPPRGSDNELNWQEELICYIEFLLSDKNGSRWYGLKRGQSTIKTGLSFFSTPEWRATEPRRFINLYTYTHIISVSPTVMLLVLCRMLKNSSLYNTRNIYATFEQGLRACRL